MAAYGADEFPAFFTRRSGCAAPVRIDSPTLAAAMIRHNARLALGSGAVIGESPFLHFRRQHELAFFAASNLQECQSQTRRYSEAIWTCFPEEHWQA